MSESLERMLAAYRAVHDGSVLNSSAIERRITASPAVRPASKRLPALLVAALALMLGGAALAATGVAESVVRDWLQGSPSEGPARNVVSPPVVVPRAAVALPGTETSQFTTPSEDPSTHTLEHAAIEEVRPSEPERSRNRGEPRDDAPKPSHAPLVEHSEAALDPSQLAMYRRGLELTGAGRHSAALAVWDRYLERYPSGPLHLEVRFSRAQGLATVGRFADAERALLPFAQGRYGRYRSGQAAALLHDVRERARR